LAKNEEQVSHIVVSSRIVLMCHNRIISLVTPLLRRMVTNERQRQYAMETRAAKAPSSEDAKAGKKMIQDHLEKSAGHRPQAIIRPQESRESPSQYSQIDPKLDNYHYSLDSNFRSRNDNAPPTTPKTQHSNGISMNQEHLDDISEAQNSDPLLQYHVNIVSNGVRIRPKITLTPASCPGFPSLVQHIHSLLRDDNQHHLRDIQVLGVQGLEHIDNDESWIEAVKLVQENDWMDGDVKVVVEVGSLQAKPLND
jgi:hypothetical protein